MRCLLGANAQPVSPQTPSCSSLPVHRQSQHSPFTTVPLRIGARDAFPAPHLSPAKMGSWCWQQRCAGWRLCPRAWMAHAWKRKNFRGRWCLRARSRLPTRAGRGRRVQELSKSFTPAQLQQHPLFQLHTLHPVPRFSLG